MENRYVGKVMRSLFDVLGSRGLWVTATQTVVLAIDTDSHTETRPHLDVTFENHQPCEVS